MDILALNGSITRSEMASLLVELYEKSTNNTIVPVDCPFSDKEYQNAIDEDVAKIYALGIMNGYEDMKFHPDWEMTNAEIIACVYRTVMKANNELADKYLTVPEYDSIGSDSDHWATSYLYGAKRLGLLDGVCYDNINIDYFAIRKDVIGIIANAFYQLSMANETKFLYICNSSSKYTGIADALQTDLYEYHKYYFIKKLSVQDLYRLAQEMYAHCTYYNTLEEFDNVLSEVFNVLFPSAPSGGHYS